MGGFGLIINGWVWASPWSWVQIATSTYNCRVGTFRLLLDRGPYMDLSVYQSNGGLGGSKNVWTYSPWAEPWVAPRIRILREIQHLKKWEGVGPIRNTFGLNLGGLEEVNMWTWASSFSPNVPLIPTHFFKCFIPLKILIPWWYRELEAAPIFGICFLKWK